MKKLRKIKLAGFADVLEEQEMKVITGGVTYFCKRWNSSGERESFTTTSETVADAWCGAWEAMGGWSAACLPSGYYNNGTYWYQ